MRLLLDTHAFVWWDNDELPELVSRQIQRADEVFVSAVTAWEIAIKAALGKLEARGAVATAVADYGFTPLPIALRHADAVRKLPPHHRDPFDRLLVAQALEEGLTIVTADRVLKKYRVPLLWA